LGKGPPHAAVEGTKRQPELNSCTADSLQTGGMKAAASLRNYLSRVMESRAATRFQEETNAMAGANPFDDEFPAPKESCDLLSRATM
jgi:hypothetical protein